MPSSLLPFRRLFILAAVGCTGLILQACQGPQEPLAADTRLEGPMPAFRSVLDGRPRMLTVRLDDDVRVAYDTDSGHLYNAWEGDLELKDRKSTRLNSSHVAISYAVFCLKKKK